jgi:hypothetical protein
MTVTVADAAPAVPVIAEDEVDIGEDVDEEVEEEEEEEVLVELGAADDVPGKSLRAMAWNVASVRGFWQLTVLSGYPQQDQSCEVALYAMSAVPASAMKELAHPLVSN